MKNKFLRFLKQERDFFELIIIFILAVVIFIVANPYLNKFAGLLAEFLEGIFWK